MRQGLRNLEGKVEQLAQQPGVEEGGASTPVAPSSDAAVHVVAATVKSDRVYGGGEDTIREELRVLKTKVDIIAANVLGEEAEGESMDIASTGPSPEREKLFHRNDEDNSETLAPDVKTAEDIASIDAAENNTKSRSPSDDESEGMTEEDSMQQEREGAGSASPRLLPQYVKARSNWTKVRLNRAYLVKKIRRQVRVDEIRT